MAGFLGAAVAGSWRMGGGIAGSSAVRGAGRYAAGGVKSFVSRYMKTAPQESVLNARISYLDYDWALNDAHD